MGIKTALAVYEFSYWKKDCNTKATLVFLFEPLLFQKSLYMKRNEMMWIRYQELDVSNTNLPIKIEHLSLVKIRICFWATESD